MSDTMNLSVYKRIKPRKKDNISPRIMIEKVDPEIDGGTFSIKRIVGENVVVRANIFADGHDEIMATLIFRTYKENDWHEVSMKSLGNDRWIGAFSIEKEEDCRHV